MRDVQNTACGGPLSHDDEQAECLRLVERCCVSLKRELSDSEHSPREILLALLHVAVGTLHVHDDRKEMQVLLRRLASDLRANGEVVYAGRPASLI